MPIDGEKIVNLQTHVAALRADRAKLARGLATLRRLLRAMRWHKYGGYAGVHGGTWTKAGFLSTSLPQTTPEELDALFAFAGIEPDEIESKGDCFHCTHATEDGEPRGYFTPCASCNGIRHNEFVPADRLTMLARFRLPLDRMRQRNREATVARLSDPKPEEKKR